MADHATTTRRGLLKAAPLALAALALPMAAEAEEVPQPADTILDRCAAAMRTLFKTLPSGFVLSDCWCVVKGPDHFILSAVATQPGDWALKQDYWAFTNAMPYWHAVTPKGAV